MSIQAVALTMKMIERRDEMRRLLGVGYQDQVAMARRVLVGVSAEKRVDIAAAALAIGRDMVNAGAPPDLMICALVDEAEARGAAVPEKPCE